MCVCVWSPSITSVLTVAEEEEDDDPERPHLHRVRWVREKSCCEAKADWPEDRRLIKKK